MLEIEGVAVVSGDDLTLEIESLPADLYTLTINSDTDDQSGCNVEVELTCKPLPDPCANSPVSFLYQDREVGMRFEAPFDGRYVFDASSSECNDLHIFADGVTISDPVDDNDALEIIEIEL